MAGLFTNLSLWIGAFMLIVVFRVEVDTEGFKRVTVPQAYVGRFILMAIMVALQAIIVAAGNLIIGVQTVNALAFIGTAVLVGLAYLSIIYALASTLGLVGKFIAVLLVIMQIPGASGLYPIRSEERRVGRECEREGERGVRRGKGRREWGGSRAEVMR